MNRNKVQVNYKGIILDLIQDGYIYEVFYNKKYLGYFHQSKLNEVTQEIEKSGFYDGYNYDYRLKELNVWCSK
jgi:hypothetical protein